jgi:hypothetical protein
VACSRDEKWNVIEERIPKLPQLPGMGEDFQSKTVGMGNSEMDTEYPTSILSHDKTQRSKSL